MPEFPVNPERFDPYKNFKFHVKWDGRYVAGVSSVSALRRTTEVVLNREGGDPSIERHSPGRTAYDPITLRRGRTQDTDFEAWAAKVWTLGAGAGTEVSPKDFRKDIVIELQNEALSWSWGGRCTAAGRPTTSRCPTSTRTLPQSRSRA